ncbi:hypothetical protein E4U43_004157, partial [Claviceps pusilla]
MCETTRLGTQIRVVVWGSVRSRRRKTEGWSLEMVVSGVSCSLWQSDLLSMILRRDLKGTTDRMDLHASDWILLWSVLLDDVDDVDDLIV